VAVQKCVEVKERKRKMKDEKIKIKSFIREGQS